MATKNRRVQIESGVDATGARKGMGEIKDAAKDMAQVVGQQGQEAAKGVEAVGAGSDVAAAKVERNTKSMVQQLQRLTAEAQAGSKNSPEYFTARAKQLGIDPQALQPYLQELAAVRQAQAAAQGDSKKTEQAAQRAQQVAQGAVDGMGMSAKATSAALRQLPAQFTDIVVALQGGQKPVTVLLQQGGQLKDVFGGIGPAARALGSYIGGLVTPTTLAVGATGALVLAWYEGTEESRQFTVALAESGHQVGLTTFELTSMARAIRDLGNGTQGRASEVLALMASDAALATGGLQQYADAAVRLEREGGRAAENTAKMFSEIGHSPVEAALKYNQTLNFLTPTIYQQIKALHEQGRTQDAARVALDALTGATNKQADEIGKSLGYLQRMSKTIKEDFKGMWDALLDVGRPDGDLAKKVDTTVGFLDYIKSMAGMAGAMPPSALPYVNGAGAVGGADLARQQMEKDAAEAKRRQAVATQALADLDKQADQFLPRRVQMEREIASARENAHKALAGDLSAEQRAKIQGTLAQTERGIREKYDPGLTQAQSNSSIEAVRRQLGELTSAYSAAETILEAQRKAGAVSEAEYYEAKRAFIRLDQEAQVAALRAENAALAERSRDPKLTSAERVANGDKVKDNLAKIAEANGKAAAAAVVLGAQQTSALDGVAKAYAEAKLAAEDYLTTLQVAQQRDLNLFDASNRTRQDQQARNQISDRYQQERQRIQNERALTAIQQGGTLTSDQKRQFDDLLALNRDYESQALSSYTDYVEARNKLEGNWAEGAGRAFRNYLDDAQDVAKQTEGAFTNAFDSLDNAVTVSNGHIKLSFSSTVDSIIADLARIALKQSLMAPLSAAAGLLGIPGFAKGGVFDSWGEVKRFAHGDVFDRPTAFSFGGGRRGELGEAGPEAIMPLARGAGGKLGVMVADGGRQPAQFVYAPTLNIDGSADRARGLQDAEAVMRKGQREYSEMLKARGVL